MAETAFSAIRLGEEEGGNEFCLLDLGEAIWAMRSPGLMTNGSFERFTRITLISPR
jgi:hypothetical protein